MKKLLLSFSLLIMTPSLISAQYSNYYQLDANVNINEKVDVSGEVNVNKTVQTIDYGALAQANAMRERNRLSRMEFENEKEKQAVQAIVANPLAAYDYGTRLSVTIPTDVKRYGIKNGYQWGYRKFEWSLTFPHNYLFQTVQAQNLGWSFQNISENQIRTSIDIFGQFYPEGINRNKKKLKNYNKYAEAYDEMMSLVDLEKLKSNVLSEKNKIGKVIGGKYIHKVEVSRTTVCGCDGFKVTKVLEDEFEKLIEDSYKCSDGELFFYAIAKYRANKDVSFEEIEGRRFYLMTLIDKIISTSDYGKTWK